MQEVQVRLSARLTRRLERRLTASGDPSAVLCELIERGLAKDSAADTAGPPLTVTVRLGAADMALLEQERRAAGLSRAEWIRACLRARLTTQRQLGRQDRNYLRNAVAELRSIAERVKRLRWAGEQNAPTNLCSSNAIHALSDLESRLAATTLAIHDGFLGNDAYWRDALADAATSAEEAPSKARSG